ncbi:MAG: hypothetical protein Q9169_008160, partial [Polycauliona sp. 2 TL-2023]
RITTKNLSYPMHLVLLPRGYKPLLLETDEKVFNRPYAPESFSAKITQLRQLGSLLHSQKNVMASFPGIKDNAAFSDAFEHMDNKLESVSAELGQLRNVTNHVFPREDSIPFSGDHFAYEGIKREARNEKTAQSTQPEEQNVTYGWE